MPPHWKKRIRLFRAVLLPAFGLKGPLSFPPTFWFYRVLGYFLPTFCNDFAIGWLTVDTGLLCILTYAGHAVYAYPDTLADLHTLLWVSHRAIPSLIIMAEKFRQALALPKVCHRVTMLSLNPSNTLFYTGLYIWFELYLRHATSSLFDQGSFLCVILSWTVNGLI